MFDQFSSSLQENSLETDALNFALNQAQSKLQTFFATSTASEELNQVFDITDQNASNLLITNGKNAIFDIPQLQILPDTMMNGAQAAFSVAKDTIYLAESLLESNTLDIEKAIIEEMGHKFDTLLNPNSDTPGDEGEKFKNTIFSLPVSDAESWRIQTENDFGTIIINSEVIEVEQSYTSLVRSSPGFTKNLGGWTDNTIYPRVSGDVNGDGKDDIVGFGASQVAVSLSNGDGTFRTPITSTPSPTNGFTTNVGGWTNNNLYPRMLGDVNGDGRDDIVGFGISQVSVSLSNGSGSFSTPINSTPSSTNGFTTGVGGWTDNNTYPRMLGDVNGDGRDDIVGFGANRVFVSLSNGNGTFGVPIASLPSSTNGFTTGVGGWTNNNTYPRMLGDVNGDGRDDIVGFGTNHVFVSLSNGNGTFGVPIASLPSSTNGFTTGVGGWTDNNNYPRVLADVNGDNRDDIVGFGGSSVFVSLSNGNGTFAAPASYNIALTKNNGSWTDNNNYPRIVGDVNGDRKDDLIGFGASDVFTSLSGTNTVTKPTVSLTTTDSSAAETTSGQTANPGQFTVTRTGVTTNPLLVYYTTGGTATKGTDYQNIIGSVTIPAGSTTATIPINVIDDTLVEGSETAIVNLSTNTNYNLGTTSGTVTIADNDIATSSIGVNQNLSGSLSTTDPNNPTRSSSYKDDYRLTGITAGQPVKVNLNSSAFDAYLQIINESTGTVVIQNDDANGTNSEVTFTPQSGVNYLVRVTSYQSNATGTYSIVTSSSTSTTKPTVSLTTTDGSAAETTSGQIANPGQFTVTRTGVTTNPLLVYYTTGGTATKGTDYQNIIGSVTIPAGSTTAPIPINVIDDTLVEGSETAIVNLSTNTNYNLGTTSGTVTITDNDIAATKPTVSLTTTDGSAAETISGQIANPGQFTVTRTGVTTNPLLVYYTTSGTATKGTDYQNIIGSVTIPAGSTTATIPINVIDDTLVESSETAIVNLSTNTNYNLGTTSGTVTIADNDATIPTTSWKAEYFNNISLSGTPVFTENLGSGSGGFNKNWGSGSPASSVPVDNFSARMTTQRYLAPGLYHIKTNSDDGARVSINNQSVIDRWIPGAGLNSGYFYSTGGNYPVKVEYLEYHGGASIDFSITPATKFRDAVDTLTQWNSIVYSWNSSQGTPPTNFWEGDINNPNAIGAINLGSNTRSDGKKGINVNWGQGAPNGDGNRLPHNFFAMRAHTQADFDGSPYKFRVSGDDGFQLFALNLSTGQGYNITSANSINQWTQSYSPGEITSQLPAGRYAMHFHLYEGAGDARFDLSWEKAVTLPPVSNTYQLPYPNGARYNVTAGWDGHHLVNIYNDNAWDFGMPEGHTVVAARGGRVVSLYEGSNTTLNSTTGWATYTNYVVIDHGDGTSGLYAHLKYNSVLPNVGDYVSQNQPIAQSGNTGHSSGPHLHYSVQRTPPNIPAGGFGNRSGYWQESIPSSFTDPDVLRQNPNGVPTRGNWYTS
jgi:murein DD-endopeptidase MepM/ murein hydrolase activator NlpD